MTHNTIYVKSLEKLLRMAKQQETMDSLDQNSIFLPRTVNSQGNMPNNNGGGGGDDGLGAATMVDRCMTIIGSIISSRSKAQLN